MILEEKEYMKEKYERRRMRKLKIKMFPYLCNLLLVNQIILFDITNDTTSAVGSETSMIDHSVHLSDCWEKHSKLFRAVNGEIF